MASRWLPPESIVKTHRLSAVSGARFVVIGLAWALIAVIYTQTFTKMCLGV
jgi:hypothetical protein